MGVHFSNTTGNAYLIHCMLYCRPEHKLSQFMEVPAEEWNQTFAKTFHLTNLQSGSQYRCSVALHFVGDDGSEMELTRESMVISALTRLSSVQNITYV